MPFPTTRDIWATIHRAEQAIGKLTRVGRLDLLREAFPQANAYRLAGALR